MSQFQPCIYIMASGRRGYVYIGVTSHLLQRVAQHRDWKFNLVESENPDWVDLGPDLGLGRLP